MSSAMTTAAVDGGRRPGEVTRPLSVTGLKAAESASGSIRETTVRRHRVDLTRTRMAGMKYMMLIAGSEEAWAGRSEEELKALYGRIGQWWDEHAKAGRIGEGHEL